MTAKGKFTSEASRCKIIKNYNKYIEQLKKEKKDAQKEAAQKHAEIKKSKENRVYRFAEKMENMFIGVYEKLKNRDNDKNNMEEKEI